MSEFNNKTILVTGATGLIGSNLIDRLMLEEQIKVVALGRKKEKLISAFGKYIEAGKLVPVEQDVVTPFSFEEKFDYIFHAAGPMEGKIIANYPVDVVMPNLIGAKNCLDYLVKQKKEYGKSGRLILFSSVTVYANNTECDRVVTEVDTELTENLSSKSACYSQSKRMTEVIAQSYHKQYDIDIVIARFSTVYGATRFIPETAFFEFIRCAMNGENIKLNGVGGPRRDNIYVDDAIDALMLIALKGESGEPYNISSNGERGNYLAVDEIAKEIAEASNDVWNRDGDDSVVVQCPDGNVDKRKPGLSLDNSKLKKLGWNISNSFHDGIVKTFENLREGNM